jgi:hypothetical protein
MDFEQEKLDQDLTPEEEGVMEEGAGEEVVSSEEEIRKDTNQEDSKKTSGRGKWVSRISRNKKVLIPLLAVLIGGSIMGAGFLYKGKEPPEKTNQIQQVLKSLPVEKESESGPFEEDLQPFFIPLTRDSRKKVAMVRISIIWDKETSEAFRTASVKIRGHLYQYMKNLAQSTKNFSREMTPIKTEVFNAIASSLGTRNLQVLMKGIFLL